MAEFRKREDINQELDILQTWSELGAPRLEDLSRSLNSLVRTVDPRLLAEPRIAMDDVKPATIDLHVTEAANAYADLPPGDEERPRNNGLLLLSCGTSTVRFMPPLNVSVGEVDEAIALLRASLDQALTGS